jgi:imidazoleglycerol phosphate dehydratase HisB
MTRQAQVTRKTRETDIEVVLNLDGTGVVDLATGIAFLDHMLHLFAAHGYFDLTVKAAGDLEVDQHHTVEDIGICLGQAFKKALADKAGVRRYGEARVPMDEALAQVTLDLSNRPFLYFNVRFAPVSAALDPHHGGHLQSHGPGPGSGHPAGAPGPGRTIDKGSVIEKKGEWMAKRRGKG